MLIMFVEIRCSSNIFRFNIVYDIWMIHSVSMTSIPDSISGKFIEMLPRMQRIYMFLEGNFPVSRNHVNTIILLLMPNREFGRVVSSVC